MGVGVCEQCEEHVQKKKRIEETERRTERFLRREAERKKRAQQQPPEEPEPAWIFMEHSFSPSVALHHVSVSSTAATLAATAAVDLQPDDLVSFDYCLHEWLMSEPFRDAESGRVVDGFANLTEEEQDLALPRAQPAKRRALPRREDPRFATGYETAMTYEMKRLPLLHPG